MEDAIVDPTLPTQPHLAKQTNAKDLDVSVLNALTPEVISRQATINIGTIGHVAHGKSTVVRAISGVKTVRFKYVPHPCRYAHHRNELERNITIKLGYANAKLYQCTNPECQRPGRFRAFGSDMEDRPPCPRKGCGGLMQLMRHVSFVDCPGHDILMATMLNGAAVMDASLLLVAANEPCPQPQTKEHLASIEIMKLRHIIILQNKIDIVKAQQAQEQQQQIQAFVRGTVADGAPVVPISAQLKYNVDVVVEYMINKVPVPIRDFSSTPRMIVIRSFDVNRPGQEVSLLKGGVAGGSILQGVLKVGDEIEVRPGVVSKAGDGSVRCTPIRSRVASLYAEKNDLQYAVPGGLIGVGTLIDPTLCRADRLVGQVVGYPGHLPDIYNEIEVTFFLLRRLLGVKTDGGKATKVSKLQKTELLMVNIGSTTAGGRVLWVKGERARIILNTPVCTQVDEKIALSRRVEKHWRLIGWGEIKSGNTIDVDGE